MVNTHIGIAGLGAVGRVLARRLADGIPGLELAAVAARDPAKAEAVMRKHIEAVREGLLGAAAAAE